MIIALVIFGFCLLITLIILTFWLLVWYFDFPMTKEELKKELKKIKN
jgi:flagellar biosynthesis protein FlhB